MTQPSQPWNVVFLDRDTIAPQTRLRELPFPHTLTVYARTAPDQVAARIRDADIVITNKTPVRTDALRGARRVKLIAVAATGTDCIDLREAAAQGVTVCNIRNYAKRSVPEHTFALIFALRRSLLAYRESVRQGRWQDAAQFCYFDHPIRDLAGSTLGIIGAGVLGQAVANIGLNLGMRVLFAARKHSAVQAARQTDAARRDGFKEDKPPVTLTAFDEVLAQSDIITLHCPLRPETRNLIDAPEFAAMQKEATAGNFDIMLINWSGRVDPDGNIYTFMTCKGALNDGRYCNPRVDALLNQARTVADVAARKAIYDEAQNLILNEDRPIMYLYYQPMPFAVSSRIQGFDPYPDGMIRLSNVKKS